jgi:putative ABC transport system permease protein
MGTILAFPAAWYFTGYWLQHFAYRIELQNEWPTFLVSAFVAFLLTLVTVGYHVVRAASSNPVNALRDD